MCSITACLFILFLSFSFFRSVANTLTQHYLIHFIVHCKTDTVVEKDHLRRETAKKHLRMRIRQDSAKKGPFCSLLTFYDFNDTFDVNDGKNIIILIYIQLYIHIIYEYHMCI